MKEGKESYASTMPTRPRNLVWDDAGMSRDAAANPGARASRHNTAKTRHEQHTRIYRYTRFQWDQQFSCLQGRFGRKHKVPNHGNRTPMQALQTRAKSQFRQNDLATRASAPSVMLAELPQWFPI